MGMLLTTNEVADLLRVHPKHVYRLLKRGLPAHRVGDEWRFDDEEVRRFCRERARGGADVSEKSTEARQSCEAGRVPPPLLAANGDVAVEILLERAREAGAPAVGFVLADHVGALGLLDRGEVLLAGYHGEDPSVSTPGTLLARVHLAEREVGLAFRSGMRVRRASSVVGHRFAARPTTARIRGHMDAALEREGVELERAYAQAILCASHRDVVLAVVRGDADIGLTSRAWSARCGLGFMPLAAESYGLAVCASHLGDPRVVGLLNVLQQKSWKRHLAEGAGYEIQRSGEIRIGSAAGVPAQ